MLNRIFTVSLVLVSIFLTGCANTKQMAFQKDSEVISQTSKPVFLMTVTLKNSYMKSYQPKALMVHLDKSEVKDSKDHINFDIDEKSKIEDDTAESGNTYLLRMELENGDYVLRGITGTSGIFPVHGFYFAPLHVDMKAAGNGVFYLGHVAATVRERKKNEFKAGPSLPLLDQAVTGFSGGTFDITITDQQAADEATFKEKFPALRGVNIQKSILASFDKAKAQKWWEDH
jgi:hypothetical protein